MTEKSVIYQILHVKSLCHSVLKWIADSCCGQRTAIVSLIAKDCIFFSSWNLEFQLVELQVP